VLSFLYAIASSFSSLLSLPPSLSPSLPACLSLGLYLCVSRYVSLSAVSLVFISCLPASSNLHNVIWPAARHVDHNSTHPALPLQAHNPPAKHILPYSTKYTIFAIHALHPHIDNTPCMNFNTISLTNIKIKKWTKRTEVRSLDNMWVSIIRKT